MDERPGSPGGPRAWLSAPSLECQGQALGLPAHLHLHLAPQAQGSSVGKGHLSPWPTATGKGLEPHRERGRCQHPWGPPTKHPAKPGAGQMLKTPVHSLFICIGLRCSTIHHLKPSSVTKRSSYVSAHVPYNCAQALGGARAGQRRGIHVACPERNCSSLVTLVSVHRFTGLSEGYPPSRVRSGHG